MKREHLEPENNGSRKKVLLKKLVKENTLSNGSMPNDYLRLEKMCSPPVKLSYLFSQILPFQLDQNYEVKDVIGRGASGTVYTAKYKITDTMRAIKHVKKRITDNDLKEIGFIKKLNHPNIFTPIEYCMDSDNLFIVSELCQGGSLFDKLIQDKNLGEMQCKHIVKQILGALSYIHSHKIVHRDIKPENLLFESNKDNSLIKIIDFGISDNYASTLLNKICGTVYYVAPEVLKQQYNEKCDIWSLGVVVNLMLTGMQLFNGESAENIFMKIKDLQEIDLGMLTGNVTPQCKQFLENMLIVDHNQRPSAAQLLEHPWMTENLVMEISPQQEEYFSRALKSLRNF